MVINMNYQLELEKIINNLDGKKTLLLHSCCAPCSSYVITYLKDYFDITVLYYNPNIEPFAEYEKRKKEQIKLCNIFNIKVLDCDYDNELFHKMVIGLENVKEGGVRCFKCYELRLRKTASLATNYDFFGTTLTVSPFKNSNKLNEIGLNLEKEFGIKYLVSDFKKKEGYKKSILLSKKYNLYRQDFCGCVYSMKE